MKITEFIESWKAGKMPASTKSNTTFSEGYRAYLELKRKMWKNTEYNPLKDRVC